jgi:uncharacterized membrane protein
MGSFGGWILVGNIQISMKSNSQHTLYYNYNIIIIIIIIICFGLILPSSSVFLNYEWCVCQFHV